MADRVVKVSLVAEVNNYLANMEKVRQKTAEVAAQSEDTKAQMQAQTEAMNTIGRGMVAVGAIAAASLAIAVAKYAEFDKAMSQVEAATHASVTEMQALREAALQAGAETVFTATEAANAIEAMGKAGISTADILNGGLSGALDLAAAGGLGVADAADIASVALKQFNLKGTDMTHVSDLLAAGAGKAMGDVTDLSMALRQSGQVANQTGLSIEETTAALSAFASQGLLGSDAGTSFKAMLQRLTPQSNEARQTMAALGISAYDASGNFIGLEKFAGNLHDSLKGLTAEQRNSAMATIFGSDAVRAATVLYTQGADGIAQWESAVNDQGYAAETAAMRLDNLAGDIEKFGGSMDTMLIKLGSAVEPVLRPLVEGSTAVVDGFSDMGQPMQTVTAIVVGLTAAVALSGGTFLLAVPKIAEYKKALAELGTTANTTSRVIGGAFKVLGAVGAVTVAIDVINVLGKALTSAAVSTDELANALTKGNLSDALEKSLGGINSWNQFDEAKSHIEDFGAALDAVASNLDTRWSGPMAGFFDWIDGSVEPTDAYRDALDNLGAAMAGMPIQDAVNSFIKLRNEYNLSDAEMMTFITEAGPFREMLIGQADALGLNADNATLLAIATGKIKPASDGASDSAKSSAQAYLDAADSATDYSDQLKDLIDQMNELNGVGQDATSKNIKYEQSLSDVNERIEKIANGTEGYAATLDLTTQAGRDNTSALNDLASSSQEAAEAQFKLDGNTDKYKSTLEAGRQALINSAIAMGASESEAAALADQIYKMPTEKEIKILATTAEAKKAVDDFVNNWNGKQITLSLFLDSSGGNKTAAAAAARLTAQALQYIANHADGGVVDYFAGGGFSENHVAQIAPAGAWRVWAEPETGGEAYIPLAAAKRSRSIPIWKETGRRLGVYGFADGAVVQYASQSANYSPTIVMPSLDGMSLGGRLEFDQEGILRLVDGRLEQRDKAQRSAFSAGFGGL